MNTISKPLLGAAAYKLAQDLLTDYPELIGKLPSISELQTRDAATLKIWLQNAQQQLNDCFNARAKSANKPWHDEFIGKLLNARAAFVDCILARLFAIHFNDSELCLVAVGGYGRAELHPYSDIDIMLLASDAAIRALPDKIEKFVAALWDLGLDIGHSVRTFAELKTLSAEDITICTALMESRFLAGANDLYTELKNWLRLHQDWHIEAFYYAKLQEQTVRYKKFANEGYRVEPNIKYGQGGLRDLQNINWVAKRFYGAEHSMFALDFLTELESNELIQARNLLWSIRYALHLLSGRAEDRLLFDLQRRLAVLFGDATIDAHNNDGVEQFMQRYYRAILRLERLNEMLLQLMRERIFSTKHTPAKPLNANFNEYNNYLEVRDAKLFASNPRAILEVFALMQQYPELAGVGAQTIRAIRQHRHLIDDKFRRDKKNQQLFLQILRQPNGVTREFRRMNRYGILARYLPEFGNIVGRMQFDLYHIYTVDQHTIAVLGQSRIFVTEQGREQFPFASQIFDNLEKPWLLHVAALFHDIGKGCGGDHSIIGAQIVDKFCRNHGFKKSERQLLVWLVREHLLMSTTSSRKDLSDPIEIAHFAQQVGDQRRLDMLYLLTISDINGTNPNLWTSWREQLLYELYMQTKHALRRGIGVRLNIKEIKQEKLQQAKAILRREAIGSKIYNKIWLQLPAEYFRRHNGKEIAWHTKAIASGSSLPIVAMMPDNKRGASAIMLYSQDRQNLFAIMAIALDKLNLSVLDARVITTLDGKTVDTFFVQERDGSMLVEAHREREVIAALNHMLQQSDQLLLKAQHQNASRLPRQVRALGMPTQIQISSNVDNSATVFEVSTADSAGILAQIGKAFVHCKVQVQSAKINTLGARADDVFFITDENGHAFADQQRLSQLINTVKQNLDNRE